MSTVQARAANAVGKLGWGLRAAGPTAALVGAARMGALRARRPSRAVVRARSGFELEFAYPEQMPTVLVAFGDLIDPEYDVLRDLARPDWVVLDVGAAIGQLTVFSARLPVGHVHAYEPSSANLATLHANLRRNRVEGLVTVHRTALGAAAGRALFTTTGEAMVSGLHQGPAGGEVEEVEVVRLDEEVVRLGLERVDLLKVNVAGYEPAVLSGAEGLLSRGGTDVLVLLLGLESLDHYARLAGHGYRFFFAHPRRHELHECRRFDASMLDVRPWPARHVIGIHRDALERGVASGWALV